MEVLVAHYNDRHFEAVLNYFNESKITIYDKSGSYSHERFTDIRPLENVGREGETYLHHIIDRYNDLYEYTLFIQDDTHNHIQSYSGFTEQTQKVMESRQMFYQYETSWRRNRHIERRTIVNGRLNLHSLPSRDAIKIASHRMGIKLPYSYTTPTCAFFIVHRDRIRARPREFYVALRAWLLENEKNGYTLEHLWTLIFQV